ncbi:MAG: beta-lactamase family protein [Opitutaceae bacterium]|nr:beta-lactamase family protein [Opitutaceae bacterium]
MKRLLRLAPVILSLVLAAHGAPPQLPGVGAAMQLAIDQQVIAGAVTVVVSQDQVLHLQTTGLADVASATPMQPDTVFWIASMTKPVTGVALLMLQDEGKLKVSDPVAKYLPEFAALKTPSGAPANLTLAQLMTHTSGLGEAPRNSPKVRTLADVIPLYLSAPMTSEPGTTWRYCQSGINTVGRVIEVVSGQSFDAFLQQRLFEPLGMKHTTFYPSLLPGRKVATAYSRNPTSERLDASPPRPDFGPRDHPPLGNGGLYSTGPDYARFCQMLLGRGLWQGKRLLSPEAFSLLSTVQTGDMPTGFFQNDPYGRWGRNYGWGIGTCVLRAPHDGVASMLSPGTFGHGGAWGTQAWIDPVRGVAYLLLVQRTNFPNSDASDVRQRFQQAASDALPRPH